MVSTLPHLQHLGSSGLRECSLLWGFLSPWCSRAHCMKARARWHSHKGTGHTPQRGKEIFQSLSRLSKKGEDPGKPNSALGLSCQVFINPAGVASDTLGGWGGGQRPDSADPGLASLAGDTAEILHLQPTPRAQLHLPKHSTGVIRGLSIAHSSTATWAQVTPDRRPTHLPGHGGCCRPLPEPLCLPGSLTGP